MRASRWMQAAGWVVGLVVGASAAAGGTAGWQTVLTDGFSAGGSNWTYTGVTDATGTALLRVTGSNVSARWDQLNLYDAGESPQVIVPSMLSRPLGTTLTDADTFRFGAAVTLNSYAYTTELYQIAPFGLYNPSQSGPDRTYSDDLVKDAGDFVEFVYFIEYAWGGRSAQGTIGTHVDGLWGNYVTGWGDNPDYNNTLTGTAGSLPTGTAFYVQVTYSSLARQLCAAVYSDAQRTQLLSVTNSDTGLPAPQFYYTRSMTDDEHFSVTDAGFANWAGGWWGDTPGTGSGSFDDLYVQSYTYTRWSGAGTGVWSGSANWSTGAAPGGVGGDAVFDNSSDAAAMVTLDAPATLGTLALTGTLHTAITGTCALTLSATDGPALVLVTHGTHELAMPVVLSGSTRLNVANASDSLTLGGQVSGSGPLVKTGLGKAVFAAGGAVGDVDVRSGELVFGAAQTMGALSVAAGAKVTLSGSAAMVSSLDIGKSLGNWAGAVDISAGALVIDYSASGQSPMAAVLSMIQSGCDNGKWDGQGIRSSSLVDPTTEALACVDNTTMPNGPIGAIGGLSLPAEAVLVVRVHAGDVDLNGCINTDDYFYIDFNLGESGRGWVGGDLNGDGVTNTDDYFYVDFNLGETQGAAASIPEPATVLALAAGFVCLLGRPRRPRGSR